MFMPRVFKKNLNSKSKLGAIKLCNLSQYLLNLNSCMYAVPTLPSVNCCCESSGPVGKYELGILKPRTNLLVKYLKSSISPKFVPPGVASAGVSPAGAPGSVAGASGSAASKSASIPAVLIPALLNSVADVVGFALMFSSFSSLHSFRFQPSLLE